VCPILPGRGNGVWRSERPRKQGFAFGGKRTLHPLARRTGDQAESFLPAEGNLNVATSSRPSLYAEVRSDLWRPLAGASSAATLLCSLRYPR
jgi:hypothetical protein